MGEQMRGNIYQFIVMVNEIEPTIWRRILVPKDYSFWDLHVAIQDAMGWQDQHLHLFIFKEHGEEIEIGIPDNGDFRDNPDILPGWDTPIAEYFHRPGVVCNYLYDFGDGWEHKVVLEDTLSQKEDQKYPKCIDGARACPPEDCGGVPGYCHLLEVLADRRHEEHKEMTHWLGGKYSPEDFSPENVEFDDPRERWRQAFAEDV